MAHAPVRQARCWSLTTGEAGATSQAVGLAEAVGLPYQHKCIRLAAPWRWLPGHRCPWPLRGLAPGSDPLTPPWPDLLISCGRRTTAIAIAIRRASGGRTLTVHVQNPLCPVSAFDLVVPPRHDGLTGPNVLATRGALHRLRAEDTAAAGERQRMRFAHLPGPLVGVLIGGSTRQFELTPATTRQFAGQLLACASETGSSLAVTVSRRTGPEATALLAEAITGAGHFFWDGEGENPYPAILGLAQRLIVTGDSASMVSEAASTGKPILIAHLGHYGHRLERFHQALRDEGVTRPFPGPWSDAAYTPVNDTPLVAASIRTLLAERGIGKHAGHGR